jgi:hypothetical protein
MENTMQVSGRYTSHLKEIEHSIPQGSFLGLIIFILHVKDLPINMQVANMVLFANNTHIQIKATNEDILNQQIKSYAAATNLVSCKCHSTPGRTKVF